MRTEAAAGRLVHTLQQGDVRVAGLGAAIARLAQPGIGARLSLTVMVGTLAVGLSAGLLAQWGMGAAAAVSLLVGAGVDPRNISAVGFGEHHPVQPNDSDAGRAANRRTEIVLAPRLETLSPASRPVER